MILADLGHRWYEDCVAVVKKQPNVYAEVLAIFDRPWRFFNIMMSAQKYLVTDRIFSARIFLSPPFSGR